MSKISNVSDDKLCIQLIVNIFFPVNIIEMHIEDPKVQKSSSFLWTTEVKEKMDPKPQPFAKTNRPSFNVSVFGSSIMVCNLWFFFVRF